MVQTLNKRNTKLCSLGFLDLDHKMNKRRQGIPLVHKQEEEIKEVIKNTSMVLCLIDDQESNTKSKPRFCSEQEGVFWLSEVGEVK